MREPFTGAIWNNSSFLRLYKSVDECSSPLVEHLPRIADPCMQSRTTPRFYGSSKSVDETLPCSHTWTIHVCNPEQLLVFRALPSWLTRLFRVPTRGLSIYAIRNNSSFLGLFRVRRGDSTKSVDETSTRPPTHEQSPNLQGGGGTFGLFDGLSPNLECFFKVMKLLCLIN